MTARTRPTRQGLIVAVAGVACGVIGRAFGVVELYLIATALIAGVAVAWLAVLVRRPRIDVRRWIRPSVLTAGETGRVEVMVTNRAATLPPPFELIEPVGPSRTARMTVSHLPRRRPVSAGYRVPTERRGVLSVGPLTAVRTDVLGLAGSRHTVAGAEELLVSPRAHQLDIPELGNGVLGRHLLTLAQRLGTGEFHSLRDYVDGDEPRTVHWRASARSDQLKVRQHTVEGLRRVVVVLDQHDRPDTPAGEYDEPFERAVEIAASVVHSASEAGLTTRFVSSDGADVRGPDVGPHTLHLLARIQPSQQPPVEVERDPGEGLGLVVVIASDPAAAPWRALARVHDPALTPVGVFTERLPSRPGPLVVDARSIGRFLADWGRLAGTRTGRRTWMPTGSDVDTWALAGSTS
ncbi:MAG: DUF58 domain-containing protein [Desertimonas sp.]